MSVIDPDIRRTFDSLGVAVARIAELEAEIALHDKSFRGYVKEVARQIKRAEQAEAERDALRDVYRGLVGKDWNWDPRPREDDH